MSDEDGGAKIGSDQNRFVMDALVMQVCILRLYSKCSLSW